MRYAVCLRGIHYYESYMHDFRSGMTPYTIDFRKCIASLIRNIVQPLEDDGHTVDIFFLTYESEILQEIIQIMQPKYTKLLEYNPSISKTDWGNVANLIMDSIQIANEYSQQTQMYDYYITTRFDNLFHESIRNVYIEPFGISVVTPRDDNFFIISHDVYPKFLEAVGMIINKRKVTHDITQVLTDMGVSCHSMYPREFNNNKYPFMRNMRYHINSPRHIYFMCEYHSIFEESSPYYAYHHKPCLSYNSCY